ncbi:AAA family ATPase [Nocardia sp. NPDC059246]|uniref:AAA family ATPase n=1 Tax=unclassified Nocardia TaxID=2637762 RepID=UPI0036AB3ED9
MSTEFIGRERELADLCRRWEQAAHGTPRLIICRGEAGIGKTRLASELTTWVRMRGGRTLWARALEARDAPPFGLWRQAFDAAEPDIEDPATGRTRLFDGFADRLAGDEPVLLVLDDIHWADEPSLLALQHIVRGWREQRILVCANARDTSADAEAGWRAVAPELLREPVTDVLDLTGLSHGSSAACLSAAAERAVPERITAAAYRMSGGNPFYLRELGRGLRGAAGDELRLPATLREVVRGRLATAPPRAQEMLRAAAILDDAFPVAIAARRPGTELWGRLWAIDNQWESGDLTAVETELSRLRWCARHTGGPMATWHVLLTEATLAQAQARARFDDALRVAGHARELAESLGHPAGFGAYRSLLGTIGHHRGYPDEAFEIPPAAQRGEVRNQLFAVLGPAFPLAESGRLDDAAGLYRGLGPPPDWDIPPFFRLIVMTVGGSIALALGYTTHIAWFADQLRPYRDRHVVSGAGNAHYFGPVPLWLGKFAAALGDSAASERELRTALEICRDIGAQGFVVEASTDLAAVLLAGGATEEALALAKAALPQADSIGMPPWTDRLRSIAAEASARAVLSPREREVAQLVAAGLSNREIATALVLSERTAQNHVQHILTKLGFTNRAQIVAWVNHADRGRGEQGGSRPR